MMLATTRLLLCYSHLPQVRCGIVEDGGNLARAFLVSGLASDPKCFPHELVQSLDSMIELT